MSLRDRIDAFARRYGPYLIFFAAMLWATDAPFRLHLTQTLSSDFIVLGEHVFDVLFVLPILAFKWRELRKLGLKEWAAVLFIAIGGSALASIAFTQAFHYVNPSVAILLQKLQPFIVIGLASGLLHEKLTKRFWLYALLAVGGAYLISFPALLPSTYPGELFTFSLAGAALALAAAFFWGASTVFGKLVLNKVDFTVMTALRFCIAFLFLIVLTTTQHAFPDFSTVTPTDYVFLFIIAITSGVTSLFIYYKGLTYTRASVATLAELGFPLFAVIINWLFINASLSLVQLGGMAILLFAVWRLTTARKIT